jgi:hypothetical protein
MEKSNSLIGGGLFRTHHHKLKSKYPEYFYLLKHCMTSEKELLQSKKKYINITHDFYEKYYNHLDNLIRLDQLFEGFDSFRKSFEIVFGEFKDTSKIKEQALLLSNYNKLEPFSKPEDVIKYHLIQQIIYLLANVYNANERLLIKQVIVNDVLKKPTLIITTSDGKNTDPVVLPQNKFHVDYVRLKEIFDQALKHMRDKLNVVPTHTIGETRTVDNIKIDLKIMPLIKFNDPLPMVKLRENPGVKRISVKKVSGKKVSGKKGSAKKGSFKKGSVKKGSFKRDEKKYEEKMPEEKKPERKINEILIPTEQPNLPVVRVDLPRKR